MDGWIVGYGSLIWRPAFEAEERVAGRVRGWKRRFWQGSPDHRGKPGAPGRVVTVLPEDGAVVGVMAYRLSADAVRIRAELDHREKAGYQLQQVHVELLDGRCVVGELYAAAADNPNFLGPAPLEDMAAHILRSVGPSGPNAEYLTELDDALVALGLADPHIRELREALERLRSQRR